MTSSPPLLSSDSSTSSTPSTSSIAATNPTPTTQTTTTLVTMNCCKLQLSSNGAEHDMKCNLYKAQLMSQQQQQPTKSSTPTAAINTKSTLSSSSSSPSSSSSSSAAISCSSSNEKIVDVDIDTTKEKEKINLVNTESKSSPNEVAATVPTSETSTAPKPVTRPRSIQPQISISQVNGMNNVKAQAFTLSSLRPNTNRPTTTNAAANNKPHNATPIMTEI